MSSYKILSIDPGLSTCGYAITIYDEYKPYIIASGTINITSLIPMYKTIMKDALLFNESVIRTNILKVEITRILDVHNPDFIVSEAAFYNPSRPSAFASLLNCIYCIDELLYLRYTTNIVNSSYQGKLYKIPPLLIKQASSIYGARPDKEDMYHAFMYLLDHNEILIDKNVDISELDEHAIDAIHIGNAFCKLWIPVIVSKLIPERITLYTKSIRKSVEDIYRKFIRKNAKCVWPKGFKYPKPKKIKSKKKKKNKKKKKKNRNKK